MSNRNPPLPAVRLPPTTAALLVESARPYFLWWTKATVGQLKQHLASPDAEERAYWLGALLREANTRDVWLLTDAGEIRALWPLLIRYLGRSRSMWAWLLGLPPPAGPPSRQLQADHAQDLRSPGRPGCCPRFRPCPPGQYPAAPPLDRAEAQANASAVRPRTDKDKRQALPAGAEADKIWTWRFGFAGAALSRRTRRPTASFGRE